MKPNNFRLKKLIQFIYSYFQRDATFYLFLKQEDSVRRDDV